MNLAWTIETDGRTGGHWAEPGPSNGDANGGNDDGRVVEEPGGTCPHFGKRTLIARRAGIRYSLGHRPDVDPSMPERSQALEW